MASNRQCGRPRGKTLRPNDEREKAQRVSQRYFGVRPPLSDIFIGTSELAAHQKAKKAEREALLEEIGDTITVRISTPPAYYIDKMLNVDNLSMQGRSWTASNFLIPLYRDRVTGQYYNALQAPREDMPDHVGCIGLLSDWDRDIARRDRLALLMKISGGSVCGSYGSLPPKEGSAPRGRRTRVDSGDCM